MQDPKNVGENWRKRLATEVESSTPGLIELRRRLHRQPEPSGEEYQTSLTLYQQLGDLGLSVRMGPEGRGLLADLNTGAGNDLPILAIRGDIDALRIHDLKQTEYCSQIDGVMHACGHDAHTTIVYGAAACLQHLAREDALPWPIRVRFIFQPAEETSEGARAMIGSGALQDVVAIMATHMEPGLPLGRIGFKTGPLTASCDVIRIDIRGSGGHGARPYEANDPIAAAAQLVNAIYLAIPRVTQTHEAVVVTFGQIAAGQSPNVIPETLQLLGTLRTLEQSTRQDTMEHIRRIAKGMAMSTQTEIEVHFEVGTDAVRNDSAVIELLRETCVEMHGTAAVHNIPRASMGGEDFSFYLQHVPGAMIRLGCAEPGSSTWPMLHSPRFDIDERVLALGSHLLARGVINAFEPSAKWGPLLLHAPNASRPDSSAS